MRDLARITAYAAFTLGLAIASYAIGRTFGKTDQMIGSALVEASSDLVALRLLYEGDVSKSIEVLERELDGETSVASIAVAKSWLPYGDQQFAECVLLRIKEHRRAHPSRSSDQEFVALLTRLLSRDYECSKAAA